MATRIIGCGNLQRGDDAAGLLVAARLRALGCDARDGPREPLTLPDLWTADDDVILVDAVQSGTAPGSLVEWDACAHELSAGVFPCSTHAIGVREAVELARLMGRLPHTLHIYGIEAGQFTPGAPPCLAVQEAVEMLAERLAVAARA